MAHSSMKDRNIHISAENITFSLFTTEQIKKLAVLKIVTPLRLDALGHPLSGGLYDKRLGPFSDKNDLCATCCKPMAYCPGHFGYIELPLPVVNPLFYKIVGTMLRISCLSCYRIQIPTHIKRCICMQIKLLNAGLVIEATEIEATIKDLVATYESYENIPEDAIARIVAYEKVASDTLEQLSASKVSSLSTETLYNQFVNSLFRDFKPRGFCMYCKRGINKIQALKNKVIMSIKKGNVDEKTSKARVMETESKYVNPQESREYLRNIWEAEREFVEEIASVLKNVEAEYPTDVFYFDVIPVPPPNVRPVNIVNARILENKQTMTYTRIVENVIMLRTIIQVVQQKGDEEVLSDEAKAAYQGSKGETAIEKLNFAWEELQDSVNDIIDKESRNNNEGEGLKQIIEKKAGIIRSNMMGKRVNFSARSVITPDPNLDIDEIGIPEEFAKRLTYPLVVTAWNIEMVRELITNGPNVHPGAVSVECNGLVTRINPNNAHQQESILKRLLTPDDREKGSETIKVVHRHLCNKDIVLLNRQPTLHKPSIMAHRVRILKGEKTLRLHYSNCKAYNADFDGDEMNAHLPQNEVARSEAFNIVNVANQYLVPKDGTPLGGLIQDHIIAAVQMALRGRFFDKLDYQQLVYQALSFQKGDITVLPPAMIKPHQLWSGKQILSTVIINIIPKGRARINLTSTSKVSVKTWQSHRARQWNGGGSPFTNPNEMSESQVIIKDGELLVGILDKNHIGATPYGLVHCIYELYGGEYATRLLSAFGKLFTYFLQREGFTLSVRDILTVKKADDKRRKIIERSREIGVDVVTTALGLPSDTPLNEIVEKIESVSAVNPKIRAVIDRGYKSALDSYTNDINKKCLPAGLVCKFPENNLQLMVQSGAKGSTVNTMQISCLLGQIELEGKRPPVMISGKTLPCFPATEFSPRAGGFIDGRFMTGIQPQEFFFHCMAGREGLIDTAVKTSRSGYLQRCLVKHLEGLHVGYDMTVRNSDKSVIQYKYGEDGLDISKAQFFSEKQLNFLNENRKAIAQSELLKRLKKDADYKEVKQHCSQIKSWKTEYGNPLKKRRVSPFLKLEEMVKERVSNGTIDWSEGIKQMWRDVGDEIRENCKLRCMPCPDPVDSLYQSDSHFGAVNERLQDLIEGFKVEGKNKKFHETMKLKAMQSLCPPGEPVGLLAAQINKLCLQSIGEPSTQMTLNTFHFAGRGDMNVTLGIPRLREILMMASKNIKTPSMEIPFLEMSGMEEKADTLRKMLNKVTLADVLEKVDVSTELQWQPKRQYQYTLRFHFLPPRCYSQNYCVQPWMILKHTKKKYFSEMFNAIRKLSKVKHNVIGQALDERKLQM
ncbi:hypothetical protein NQ315_007356 [Exocentrus adspersus]|uniref:DNA-directed RNA polymerase subunit n=1 Tax=Exocentrus adspersus TaxID=1586481 RepID=A0AAV8VHK2_9CUCU|nr:hypothetical protein NQ315_007356 [Exocentrus adspersus]